MRPGEFVRYGQRAMKIRTRLGPISIQQYELDPADSTRTIAESPGPESLPPALAGALDALQPHERKLIRAMADYGPLVAAEKLGLTKAIFEEQLVHLRAKLQRLLANSEPDKPEVTKSELAHDEGAVYSARDAARICHRSIRWAENQLADFPSILRTGPHGGIVSYYQASHLEQLRALARLEDVLSPPPQEKEWWRLWEVSHRLGKSENWCYKRLLPFRGTSLVRQQIQEPSKVPPKNKQVWEYDTEAVKALERKLREVEGMSIDFPSLPPGKQWWRLGEIGHHLGKRKWWCNQRLLPFRGTSLARQTSANIVYPSRTWEYHIDAVKALERGVEAVEATKPDLLYYWREENYPEVLAWKRRKGRTSG